MAIDVKNNDDSILYGLVAAFNQLHQKTETVDADGYITGWHRDRTSTTSGDFRAPVAALLQDASPSATGLASSIVKANSIKGVMELHLADDQAHLIADSATKAVLDGYAFLTSASVLADVKTLANNLKAVYNVHLTAVGVHLNNDPNSVTTADATDQSSTNVLLNDMTVKLNAHVGNGPSVPRLRILK